MTVQEKYTHFDLRFTFSLVLTTTFMIRASTHFVPNQLITNQLFNSDWLYDLCLYNRDLKVI